ncbi:MAG: helix-turn-helix transcriptional regulator [Acidimicrobiales bacterium]
MSEAPPTGSELPPCYDGLAAKALRKARASAGAMSQSDLARRSGVARTVIVEVERGHRQPSIPTLARLLSGTGLQPAISLIPIPGHRRAAVGSARSEDQRHEPDPERVARPAPDDRAALLDRAWAVFDVLSLADAARIGKMLRTDTPL